MSQKTMNEAELHDALSAWAETDEPLTMPGTTRRGAEAARAGREALASAGRPSLGADHATGEGRSPRRQVRLDTRTNAKLDAYAALTGRTASEIIRAALVEYLPA